MIIIGNEEKEDGRQVIEWYKSVRNTAVPICTLHGVTDVYVHSCTDVYVTQLYRS